MEDNRSTRKRKAIIEAAAAAFLENGYLGTNMDQIASAAAVSKQTVYKHFSDKEQLFTEIIHDAMGRVIGELVRGATLAVRESDDVESDLIALARQLIGSIWQPEVLRLRRLVIGEAGRFPKLGEAYFKEGFERGIAAVATSIEQLAAEHRLQVDDPQLAAQHFAGLILWVPLNRAMFTGSDKPPPDLDHFATAGARTFLAAYTPTAHRQAASPAR
jgi:TetR/AcrR family transcriptional regulator, mexJK operon transcriptional repressor